MLILPYSTALTYSKPPVVTYAVMALCVVIFYFQSNPSFSNSLLYYPETWNPFKMLTSSIAHGSFSHITGNLIFFFAFAPAIEIIINNTFLYLRIMIFISFIVGISYSLSILMGISPSLPTLGLSGVVTGMIGLSAYLIPHVRIRVFWWYFFAGKTFYVPAWVLAISYIGLDTWTMMTASNYGQINVVAHVSGGFAGYLYGYFWLKEIKENSREELAEEVEAMSILRTQGEMKAQIYRDNKLLNAQASIRNDIKSHDRFLSQLHTLVRVKKDSDAIALLITQYHLDTDVRDLEELYEHIKLWGTSRTLLCLGRLIIEKLHKQKCYGRVLVYIEKNQQLSPNFILPNVSNR